MKLPMIRPVALVMLLALSAPSMAIEPFQPLPDLEALPDLDSAPPRKLHENQPSWGQPVDANGNPNGSSNDNGSTGGNTNGNTNGSAGNNQNGSSNDNGSASDNTSGSAGNNQNGSSNNNGSASDNTNGSAGNNQNGSSNNNGSASDNTNGSAGNNQNGSSNDNGSASDNTNGSAGNNQNGSSNNNGSASDNTNGSGLNSDAYPPLTKIDAAMQPNLAPPGMPQMPSKCAEDKACRPCFDDANANLDLRRRNLEQVRGIYTYTHRFAQEGKDLMAGVGGLAGGAPAVEAAVQSRAVDQSLDAFDNSVRSKNAELLGKLQNDLHELAACEAKYYGNDAWYPRYGELYYQFMQARYTL